MANKSDVKRIKVMTPPFRVSFPAVFQAKAVNPGETPKFSIQMLFRTKPDPKKPHEKVVDLQPLKDAIIAVLTAQFGPDRNKWPEFKKPDGSPAIRLPLRDGKEKPDVEGYGDGVVFGSASSTTQPGLVDAQKVPIIAPNEFYGGCYARATVNVFWYDKKGKGVGLGLQNIQKIADGAPFSGRAKAEDEFDAIEPPAGAVQGQGGNDPLMP